MPILVKIGSSSANDYVIHNQYVSGRHADITVLDNGDIILEDKGSTNGTFVGPNQTKLQPGKETKIQRGDLVVFGNEPIKWAKIPKPADNSGYKKVVTVGSNFQNEMVIPDSSISRYHASIKIDPKKRVYIVDNGSTNGTKVNGIKITPHQPVQIKKGHNIMLGDYDITKQVEPYFPNNPWAKIGVWAGGAVAVAALVIAIIALVKPKPSHPINPKDAVAYIVHQYHNEITPKDNPWGLDLQFVESEPTVVQGTGFFIDDEGRIGTAMHVAEPWNEEFDPEKTKQLNRDWQSYLNSTLPQRVTSYEELQYLLSTQIGQQIKEALERHGSRDPIADINAMLNILFKSELKITGVTDEIRIGYPGRMYTHWDEMERANVIAKSDNTEADVAIIQLNTKKLPEGKDYFAIEDMAVEVPAVDDTPYHYMGFPLGIVRNLDKDIQSLEPYVRESKIAKEPSKYYFEIQDGSAGGASGSPVYDQNNNLVGILYATFGGDERTSRVLHASYLKNLYENEFPNIKKNKK